MSAWRRIEDHHVLNVWRHPERPEETVEVDPTFYELSGTPCDGETGEGFEYSHTMVCDTRRTWVVLHHHKHGVSPHVVFSPTEPDGKAVVAASVEDYEPHLGEFIEVVEATARYDAEGES